MRETRRQVIANVLSSNHIELILWQDGNKEMPARYVVHNGCNAFYVEDRETGDEERMGDGVDVELIIQGKVFTLMSKELDSAGDTFAALWTYVFNRDPESQEAYFG